MIKFFRKIRQNLLMENKTGKYFKYAIGEIVLVVIGILIALQINNWNETRKSNRLSEEFHQKLADELDAVSIRFENDAERASQLVNFIGKSVIILRKGALTEKGKDTLDFTLGNFFQFVRIEGKLKTFQELESTGQLGLIHNKELKFKTFEFLSQFEAVSKMYDQIADQVNDTKLVDKHVTLVLDPNSMYSKLDYDFIDLAEDKFLINRLARFGYFWQTKQAFSKTISESSKKLKEAYITQLNKK
ncbi:DUF6090 family protein [Litoribaculum gwangyangense]|uniref:Uncharacterized protein n=1 Tax=Litoribaculum gwangyangense TaxID=1130722 RepID=A0ABP9CJT8_9FLAO